MNKQTAKALWSLSWQESQCDPITLSESLWSTDHKQQMTCRSLLVSNPLEHETLYCNIKHLHHGQRRQKDLYKLILNRNEQRQAKRVTHPVRGVFVTVGFRKDRWKQTHMWSRFLLVYQPLLSQESSAGFDGLFLFLVSPAFSQSLSQVSQLSPAPFLVSDCASELRLFSTKLPLGDSVLPKVSQKSFLGPWVLKGSWFW